jgi:hypothetical protein
LQLGVERGHARIVEGKPAHGHEAEQGKRGRRRYRAVFSVPPGSDAIDKQAFLLAYLGPA